jgi:Flp pilus assembly protein TadG
MRQMLRRWRSDEAAQLVEFALVLPLLLLVMLGIAEFGFIFQRYEVLTNAAREGARIAVLPGYTTADVQARVASYVTAGRVPTTAGNPAVLVETIAIPVGGGLPALAARRVTVSYTYTYTFVPGIAAMLGSTYSTVLLRAVSEMRSEIVAGI